MLARIWIIDLLSQHNDLSDEFFHKQTLFSEQKYGAGSTQNKVHFEIDRSFAVSDLLTMFFHRRNVLKMIILDRFV